MGLVRSCDDKPKRRPQMPILVGQPRSLNTEKGSNVKLSSTGACNTASWPLKAIKSDEQNAPLNRSPKVLNVLTTDSRADQKTKLSQSAAESVAKLIAQYQRRAVRTEGCMVASTNAVRLTFPGEWFGRRNRSVSGTPEASHSRWSRRAD